MQKKIIIYDRNEIFINDSDIRGMWIQDKGGTQKEKVSLLKKICKKEEVDVFIDMGANYGEFSVALSNAVGKIYAFEPNPWVIKSLNKTALLYDNLHIIPQAVGTNSSNQMFHFHKKYSGGGRLEKWEWRDQRYSDVQQPEFYSEEQVGVCDIAEFLKNIAPKPKTLLIKIDIEGQEESIINHIKDYLCTVERWFILFETNGTEMSRIKKLPGKLIYDLKTDVLIGKI